jgi:hypothetical protein
MGATCVIQPVDMIKVRIQFGQGGAMLVAKNVLGACTRVCQPGCCAKGLTRRRGSGRSRFS